MNICLFDIDGTLLTSGGAGKAAMEAALASAFGATTGSGDIPYSGRTDRAIGRDLFRRHQIEESPDHWERFLAAYLGHLPTCLGSHQGQVLPGIVGLLEHLRRQGHVQLGLLTGNIREGARLKLSHFGLFDYFAFGGFGDQHYHRDDVARAAWQAIQERHAAEASPERVWVIGDTPLDVQCARAIGARVAAVATGWHSQEELAAAQPDLLFADLADPGPLLRQLV